MTAVVLSGITKRYGDLVAVDGLSLAIEPGEIFVLLGPNGAGKTTTVEIAEGLRDADDGTIEILGDAPGAPAVRRRMGVMLQRGDLHAGIRTEEAVRLFAAFYDDSEDPEMLLERLRLDGVRRSTYRRLSGGERRRLLLALALVGRPSVAFLDEPTAELDIEGRATVWEIVAELRDRGAAVLLTTHQLDEAERIADRIAIMREGKLVAVGTVSELASDGAPAITMTVATPIDTETLGQWLSAEVTAVHPLEYRLTGIQIDPTLISRLTTWLAARGVLLRTLRAGTRSLEDVYLELTG